MNETLTRLISGVVYITLLTGATTYSTNSFYLLFGIFMLIAIYEFCELVQLQKILPILLGGTAFYLGTQLKTNKTNDILLLIASLFVSIKAF
jgi:phosphatidate cytidylyltransferase